MITQALNMRMICHLMINAPCRSTWPRLRISRRGRCCAAQPSDDEGADKEQTSTARQNTADVASDYPRRGGLGQSIALAVGALKPEQIFVIGGISKMIGMSYTGLALNCPAPAALSSLIGHGNAVALTMIPAGLAIWALAGHILKHKWHETRIGLATIVSVCLLLVYLFYVDGNSRRLAMARLAYRAAMGN